MNECAVVVDLRVVRGGAQQKMLAERLLEACRLGEEAAYRLAAFPERSASVIEDAEEIVTDIEFLSERLSGLFS
jgi:precorrin isomerase